MVAETTLDFVAVMRRASHPLSHMPRPFLRWAGSKRSLLTRIIPHLPHSYRGYYEPFLGSGALFLTLRPPWAALNDSCTDLIEAWEELSKDPEGVVAAASDHHLSREEFYQVRRRRSNHATTRAGEFIFLNHGCFNGLYRVNSRGEFNVPWGAPKSGFVIDRANALAISNYVSTNDIQFANSDFEATLKDCRRGDLVYLDPPYVTRHNSNGFAEYNEKLFSWSDQVRLAFVAEGLVSLGVHVLVTNALQDDVIELYPSFDSFVIDRATTLAGSANRRGRTSEALLVGQLDRHI